MKQFPNKYGYNLKFLDILDDHGCMLKRKNLNVRLESNTSQLFYNCILTAIHIKMKI